MKTTVKIISVLLAVLMLLSGCTIRIKVKTASKNENSENKEPTTVINPVPDDVSEMDDKGFKSFAQSTLAGDYPVRTSVKGDVTRSGDNKFAVTGEKLNTAVDKIDSLVSGQTFASLLNLNGTLSDVLGGVLDGLYSDSIVNALIQYLFPVVVDTFINIWEKSLPRETFIEHDQLAGGGTDINLNFFDLESSCEKLSLYVFPNIMADNIGNIKTDYPSVYNALSSVTTRATLETNPWKDSAIYNEETGALTLNWGVTDYESFIKAVDTALKPLEPLLLALFCGKDVALSTGDYEDGIGNGGGKGKYSLIPLIPVTIDVSRITLKLSAKGCSGYNDALVPLFELLGASDIRDGNQFETVEQIFRGIFEPVQEILAKIGKDPLGSILDLLPNLAYGIKADMLNGLLGMISADIEYSADADYTATVFGGKFTAAEGEVEGAYKCDEPIPINFADILNLENMGIDTSSINALINSVLKLVKIDINVPPINDGLLASLGELQILPSGRTTPVYGLSKGERYYIKANRADVLYALLNWLFKAIRDDANLLPSILKLAKVDSLPDIANDIIGSATKDVNNTIAAVTELIVPEKYAQPHVNYSDPTPLLVEPSSLYSLLWTEQIANLAYENIGMLIDQIMGLMKKGSLGDMITDLINTNLLTNNTLNSLCITLKNALNDKSVAPMLDTVYTVLGFVSVDGYSLNVPKIKEAVNFFKNYKDGYKFGFEDGDAKGFIKAIVDKIRPLFPVLKFLLTEANIEILGTAKAYGGSGYAAGIVPLLEALGCKNILTKEQYYAKVNENSDNLIYGITDPILALLEEINADPIKTIVDILPNLCYFIEINGIDQALNALLNPVYVVLDTIRPLMSVEFSLSLTPKIKEAVKGIEVSGIKLPDINFADFIVGTPEKYTSKGGYAAIKINGKGADTISAVLNYVKGALSGIINVETITSLVGNFGS